MPNCSLKKKELESYLERLETFKKPNVKLEQYSTGVKNAGKFTAAYTDWRKNSRLYIYLLC
jgi:predicted RNA methylase